MATSKQITLVCEQCGKSFTRYASTAKHGNPRFCSHPCHYAYFREHDVLVRNPPVERQCETCGKPIMVRSTETRRFCSQACMLVWRGPVLREKRYQPETHATFTCEWCGESFEMPRSWVRPNGGRFCSGSCRAAWVAATRQNRVSKVETRFAEMLAGTGLIFERHAAIGHYAVDIYFPDARLIVEFDGEYWHSLPRNAARDKRKDAYAAKHGYRILHVPERTFLDAPDEALRMVRDALT